MTVADACRRARTELSRLGDLADPLLAVLTIVERVGADRRVDVLDDPHFALEVLTAGEGCDAASVGRLIEFLRQRTSAAHAAGPPVGSVSIADAVAQYERGALALMARGTQHTYRTWTRRLVAEHGDRRPESLSAGDLTDLIAHHVLAKRTSTERRRSGRSAEENAVGAFRHLWGYLVEKRYADTNVAMRLRKPARVEPRRRGFTAEESALLRELARAGSDPLLDEVTLVLPERLGLRRTELCRLRLRDIDTVARVAEIWGKGDRYRKVPIPPQLFQLLEAYVDTRRPEGMAVAEWWGSDELLLRRPPSPAFPLGRAAGRRRIEDLFKRLQYHAPSVFDGGDVSLHSYRHALGTFTEQHYGRAVTRAVLGHSSRRTPTDHYVHISIQRVADVLAEYEQHLLTWRDC